MRKLFLDDVRMPINAYNLVTEKPGLYTSDDWDIVRNYKEFVNYITTNGLPDLISFDHDLSLEHIKYFFNNGGHQNPPDPSDADFIEKTGYDCAKWLVNYVEDNNLKLPEYIVHSANPIGRKNIQTYLDNAKKVLNL